MLTNIVGRVSVISIICSLIIGCCFENPIESYLELNPLLSDSQLDGIVLEEGISYHEIELKNGEIWQIGLYVPDIAGSTKVPLVIALSGDGPGRGEFIPYLECLAAPGLQELNGIIFAPDNRAENSWDYDNVTLVLSIIDHAIDNWPIDIGKIIVTGHSNGGYGAWYFGVNFPQVFSAAIPIASRMEYLDDTFIKNEKLDIPFYVIHSTSDELFDIQAVSNKIERLVDLGSEIHFEKIDHIAHNSVCAYSVHLKKSITWLENEIWK